jgi:hypothetical protein
VFPGETVAGARPEQLGAGHRDDEQLVAVHGATPSTALATMREHQRVDGLHTLVIVDGATPAADAIAVLVHPAATSSPTRSRTLSALT